MENYTTKYITPDLKECRTEKEWHEWFLKEGNQDKCDGWNDPDTWFQDMLKNGDLIKTNSIAYFPVKTQDDQVTPISISVYLSENGEFDYYDIAYDGCSVSGSWKDITKEFRQITGVSVEDYFLRLLREKNTEYHRGRNMIRFVIGNQEVFIKRNDTKEMLQWIEQINNR